MEPLRKQRNPDLIVDPNIILSASISNDEMWKYKRMTKGMPRIETTGPAQADLSVGIQISAERLALLLAYP
ncbi:hypothetical protein V6N11_075443 [Hibiscus sabdariffa]|uniref:Uncharacterized protein n=1 Tax=Hibiscus sabdariffa TaxID=183260 RepID=A0ABR2R6Q3_9ROSI